VFKPRTIAIQQDLFKFSRAESGEQGVPAWKYTLLRTWREYRPVRLFKDQQFSTAIGRVGLSIGNWWHYSL